MARQINRVYDIFMKHCPNRGAGEFKIVAAILERPMIEKILTRLWLDPQPPPYAPAREPGRRQIGRAVSRCRIHTRRCLQPNQWVAKHKRGRHWAALGDERARRSRHLGQRPRLEAAGRSVERIRAG
jgi:hypothetical protein